MEGPDFFYLSATAATNQLKYFNIQAFEIMKKPRDCDRIGWAKWNLAHFWCHTAAIITKNRFLLDISAHIPTNHRIFTFFTDPSQFFNL